MSDTKSYSVCLSVCLSKSLVCNISKPVAAPKVHTSSPVICRHSHWTVDRVLNLLSCFFTVFSYGLADAYQTLWFSHIPRPANVLFHQARLAVLKTRGLSLRVQATKTMHASLLFVGAHDRNPAMLSWKLGHPNQSIHINVLILSLKFQCFLMYNFDAFEKKNGS